MKKLLIPFFFLIPFKLLGEPTRDDVMHITAHFGGVYAITYTVADICMKMAGKKHKLACTVTGAVLANAANVAYKAEEKFPGDTTRSLTAGAAGSGLAVGMIVLVW